MRMKPGVISFTILVIIQLILWASLNAAEYNVSDIALTPGQDITQLNIAWHHSDDKCNCVVEIAEKSNKSRENDGKGTEFPENSNKFHGTNKFIGLDENSAVTYACEATVSGLENRTDYSYRLGNDRGQWSDIYAYATRDENRYGFFYTADSQIGASGPNPKSQEMKAYIAEYLIRKEYPDLSDADVALLVNACTNNMQTEKLMGLTEIQGAVDLIYNSFSNDTEDELSDLKKIDPVLAEKILALQMSAAEEDSKGWAETVSVMTENFPEAAFMLSGGDQVNLMSREYEYTVFFTPPELTSLPVAPAIGSHDQAINFDYHFNLPNESSEYGVDGAGADYYFSYGNTLFMVLNMDATQSVFPRNPGGMPRGGPPPLPPSGQKMNRAAYGRGPGGPAFPNRDVPIDSEEAFEHKLAELEQYCDAETGECYDKLENFKKSIAGHQTFMKEAIAANPNAKWKVVMWHYSIYSAGMHATDDVIRGIRHYMVPVLDDFNIDVVLLAHDHCFTRTRQMLDDDPQLKQKTDRRGRVVNPTGILYLTANSSSGSKYYELNRKYDVADDPDTPAVEGPDPYFDYVAVAGQLKKPTFSYITVDPDSLQINTYRADTMEMIDSYAIVKE